MAVIILATGPQMRPKSKQKSLLTNLLTVQHNKQEHTGTVELGILRQKTNRNKKTVTKSKVTTVKG